MKWLRDIPTPPPAEFPGRAFLSIQPHPAGGFIGAYREFVPEQSNVRTMIRTQRYTADFELDGPSVPLTTAGEDPRTFCWRDSVWTLVELPKNGTCDCDFILVDLITRKTIYVRHDLSFGGKNWMPVTGAEELYLVRSIDPLCVLRMHDSGRCETVIYQAGPIGERRGGCNASFTPDGRIVGHGHETRSRDNHVPIGFVIDLQRADVDFTYPAFGPVDPLTDPTSQWDDLIVCSCARVNWWIPQPITHRLYSLAGAGAIDGRSAA